MKKIYVTKKIEVKKYEDLSNTEKQRQYFNIVDSMGVSDNFQDYLCDKLNIFTNSTLKYQYDLSGTQGGGVNIYGVFDIVTDGKKIVPGGIDEILEKYECNVPENFKFQMNNRYCYSCKFKDKKDLDEWITWHFDCYCNRELEEKDYITVSNYLTKILDYFIELEKELKIIGCDLLYPSDNDILDYCNENCLLFGEDNNIYYEWEV